MTLVLKVTCRGCNRECGDYKHLLDETVIDDEQTTLAALLNYCTALDCIDETNEYSLPQHICNSCVEHLLQSYLFKEMVLQNDRLFREQIKQEGETEATEDFPEETDQIHFVEEEDIDVGGGKEDSKEFSLKKDDNDAEENSKAVEECIEYEMEEWLEVDEIASQVAASSGTCQQEEEEDFYKIEFPNGDDEFIIADEEGQSNSLEAFKGFEKENEHAIEEEDEEDETETKVSRKKFVKPGGLTEDDLKCQYCGKQFDKMCRLREHTYVHTGEKPHVCKLCGKRSRTKTHYNVHMLTHSEEKRYHCSICGQNYRTSTSLRVHERKHSDIRPYACTICDKSFHTSEQKKLHIMMHTGERPFSCELCGKSYRENHSLKQHILTHNEKKPFECEVCGKGLTQMSGYKRHMLLHTNQYPYSCDICGRPFRISSNLVAHKRLHLDVLPFQCTLCGRGFNNSTRLKKHMVQHEEGTARLIFKARKSRQEAFIVDTKMSKSRVVEII